MPKKWSTKPTDPSGQPHHWYATSIADWRVDDNLETLIARMKGLGFDFQIWRVSLPIDAEYRISNYAPEVPPEKLHFVGFWRQKPEVMKS